MFSRWHPATIVGWAGGGWKLRRQTLPQIGLCLAIALCSSLFAGPVSAYGNEARRAFGLSARRWQSPATASTTWCGPVETIYSIAGAYRTTAYRIRYCNGLPSYRVYTGQTPWCQSIGTRRAVEAVAKSFSLEHICGARNFRIALAWI